MTVPADANSVPHSDRSTAPGALLPWLAPDAGCLSRLARAIPPLWPSIRHDPGTVLLVFRLHHLQPGSPTTESLCHSALPLACARYLLARPAAGLPGGQAESARLRWLCVRLAATCERLAQRVGYPHPDRAWSAGLLAPLGSLAVDAGAAWTGEPTALARRLARHWGLPPWLGSVVSNLDLSSEEAHGLVDDPALFALTRLAAALLHRDGRGLERPTGDVAADERAAGLRLADVPSAPESPAPTAWTNPCTEPLLPALLELALENRRLRRSSSADHLQREVDHLHAVVRRQGQGEGERLRIAKLSALAEFAAGAGHEINNPLAVISGQAQYVLAHACDWLAADADGDAQEALGKIIRQTARIHGILRELHQFARPTVPRPGRLDLAVLVPAVAAGHAEAAATKEVRVEIDVPAEPVVVWADAEQVKTALGCLLRNAVEAAPAGGWARLILRTSAGSIEVAVEDSGPGPRAEQAPHLFDPFYSGRSAGRGKGLGLPMAWRLAQQQGGDVVYVPPAEGQPTRFVLTLPRGEATRAA